MSDLSEKLSGSGETQADSLVRGGIGFFGGMLLCGAALIVQAGLLHAISRNGKRTN